MNPVVIGKPLVSDHPERGPAMSLLLLALERLLPHVQRSLRVDRKALRKLAGWELLERVHKLLCNHPGLEQEINIVYHPVLVLIGSDWCPFVWIHSQVKESR